MVSIQISLFIFNELGSVHTDEIQQNASCHIHCTCGKVALAHSEPRHVIVPTYAAEGSRAVPPYFRKLSWMLTWRHPGLYASLRYTVASEQCSRAAVLGSAAVGASSSLALVPGPAAAAPVLPVPKPHLVQAVAGVGGIVPAVRVRPVSPGGPEAAMEAALAQKVYFPIATQVLGSERDGKLLLARACMVLTCPICPAPVPMAGNCGVAAAAPFPLPTPIYAAKALRCSSVAISPASWARVVRNAGVVNVSSVVNRKREEESAQGGLSKRERKEQAR